ncbi:LysM repeat-containing protein [Pedococcus cremeus]|uniref:LysM repeat-containing protein n=1 Tax=Pedococcus cremeus TaxID=587636 RepID=A0A1H9T4F5_9MICO|nr:LysM peptidoglycan-binding domain-containing protein [Pedococcus cremeus]SER92125.1 LysM repeat-containing protein [Pedococcus cremeus]
MSPVFAHLPATSPAALPQTAIVQRSRPAPHGWTTHVVRSGDTVADLAVRYGTTNGVIVQKNHLRAGGAMLQVGQRLTVPRTAKMAAQAAARAKAARVAAAKRRAAEIRRTTYTVRSGDTLSGIASKRHVSLASLLKRNKLRASSTIYVGQKLRLPGSGGGSSASSGARRTASHTYATARYRVKSGDTLGAIAQRAKMPLGTLLKLNHLSTRSVIHPGQVLKVKGKKAAAHRPAATGRYNVRSGDTLSAIAVRLGTTQAALVKLNRLRNPHSLQVGQKLRVPARAKAKPAYSSNTFAGRTYPNAVVRAAARNRDHLARAAVPSRAQTRQIIVSTARRHGVDPRLALAVSWQESGWNQRQVSVANAIGVMQVIPSSGEWASQMAGRRLNLLRTQDNVTAGVVILRSLTRSAKNTDQAIAGYYQGLYSVQHHGMYADTKRYVAAVKAHRARM